MDILDIDEALKDDSFIFPEEKTIDDVTNILQQWKNNNCLPLQQEHVFKLNSRTFTRPRRKSSQNLESQFSNVYTNCDTQASNALQSSTENGIPMLNLEIGGPVTNLRRSFLHDISPPPSIDASITSIDRMNNSLITSADFTNINFLQSINSIDFNKTAVNDDGYTLSDVIKDRKTLESLTMSGDSDALIKDTQIGQIDDIAMHLSKTASGCSTMDNSTDSFGDGRGNFINNCGAANALQQTMVLSEEFIGNVTFDLVASSFIAENQIQVPVPENIVEKITDVSHEILSPNETFKKPRSLDETFNAQPKLEAETETENTGLKQTPENMVPLMYYESTPQTTNLHSKGGQQHHTSMKHYNNDTDISPIVAPSSHINASRKLNETFVNECLKSFKVNSRTFSDRLPHLNSTELLENVENPINYTFQQSFLEREQNDLDMQNVVSLAQAEAKLLASNDDEEEKFEHMLDEFSRVQLNREQMKINQSLDSIKRKFKPDRELSQDEIGINTSGRVLNTTINKMMAEKESTNTSTNETAIENKETSPKSGLNTAAANSNNSSPSGRLLSRRSRLYDNINLTAFSITQSTPPATTQSKSFPTSTSTTSRTLNEKEAEELALEATEAKETEAYLRAEEEALVTPKTEDIPTSSDVEITNGIATSFKLGHKRERDRDRFKTIKIEINAHDKNSTGTELNVPCIDNDNDNDNENNNNDDYQHQQHNSEKIYLKKDSPPRTSRRDCSKIQTTNYLTYKKPKDGQSEKLLQVESEKTATTTRKTRLEPRSLSRPRYVSNLQKLSINGKTSSAGDLDGTNTQTRPFSLAIDTNTNATCVPQSNGGGGGGGGSNSSSTANINCRYKPTKTLARPNTKLKSPMGTKSKSFHNLVGNFGFSAPGNNGCYSGSSLKNLNSSRTSSIDRHGRDQKEKIDAPDTQQQQCNDATFKAPKPVSGIRGPGIKRAGLVRPSSGYYSMNVLAKNITKPSSDPYGEYSPTESLSSASSRGSVNNGPINSNTITKKPLNTAPTTAESNAVPNNIVTKKSATRGIPMPSGLRPPSNATKRSGLPRPANATRR